MPLGYWLLWFIWTVLAIVSICSKRNLHIEIEIKIIIIGFLILLLGVMLSAVFNQSIQTIYQGLKLFVIACMGVCIIKTIQGLHPSDVSMIAAITVFISFLVFLISKYFFTPLHLVFGDGRQGSLFAAPGTLWKAGYFSALLALSSYLSTKRSLLSALIFVIGVYLIFVDGSRTGMLLMIISTLFMILIRVLNIKQRYSFMAICLLGLLPALILIALSSHANHNIVSMLSLPFERMVGGDNVRAEMIISGLSHAEMCLPFGCGFGATISENYGMVVHNAYLAAIGDFGVLGFIGFLLLMVAPVFVVTINGIKKASMSYGPRNYLPVSAFLLLVGYSLNEMLHSFRTEMSEWGYYFLMFAFLVLKNNHQRQSNFHQKLA